MKAWHWLTALGSLAGLLVGAWAMLDAWAWSGSIDYSRRDPANVYTQVTGSKVPAGVRNVRVSGRSGPLGLKHWVWITFDADAKTSKALFPDDPLTPEMAARMLILSSGLRYREHDQRRVGWEGLPAASLAEYHVVGHNPSGSFVWHGIAAVDRAKGRVFIQVFGD